MNFLDRILIKLKTKSHTICPQGSKLFQVDEQTDSQNMTKLTIPFFATLGMHLRYLMVKSSGGLVETSVLCSVTFEFLLKCPALLPFFPVSQNRSKKAHASAVLLQ